MGKVGSAPHLGFHYKVLEGERERLRGAVGRSQGVCFGDSVLNGLSGEGQHRSSLMPWGQQSDFVAITLPCR